MKKTLLALALVVGALATGSAQIVINEIMYNPPESGTDSLEFVELYNNSNIDVDMNNWVMQYGASSFTFPAVSLQPGKYLLLGANAGALLNNFGVNAIQWSTGALGNNGATIRLNDANGNTVDEVTYDDVAPWPTSPDQGGTSLVLCDPNLDNNLAGSWEAASTPTGVTIANIAVFANPNAASGCSGTNQLTANDDDVQAPTGQSTLLSVQTNDLISSALTNFIIITPPTQGSATVNGNAIVYQSNPGYCGADQFVYEICDANGCDQATVNITVKCYPLRSIAEMTGDDTITGVADSLNVSCELIGTVYGVNLRPTQNNTPALLFTLIENSNHGISVSTLGGTFGYTVKERDRIAVRGTIGQFNGMTEIRPDTIIKISENNPLVTPTFVTVLSETTESKLVRMINLRFVDPAEWTSGVGASGFNVRIVSDDSPNDTLLLRIDRDVETYNAPLPAQPFNLTGIGGQFDATNPFISGYQILPRYNPDISTLVDIKEADFSAAVAISPNPVSNLLNISMNERFERVSIFRADGSLIKTYRDAVGLQKVDVSLYPAGTYFVRFEKGGKIWSTRFVKA